jgi:hypothetical protein
MSEQPVTIDIDAEVINENVRPKINPILEIGLTEDGKNLACKQLTEIQFNGFMVNGMCQVIIDFFANSIPEDKREDFKLTILDLILQTRNYKQEEKPTLVSL